MAGAGRKDGTRDRGLIRMMLPIVTKFALGLSVANWIAFILFAYKWHLAPRQKLLEELVVLLHALEQKGSTASAEEKKNMIDLGAVVAAAGTLAEAFKKAGAASTAAALSVICLILALVAAHLS